MDDKDNRVNIATDEELSDMFTNIRKAKEMRARGINAEIDREREEKHNSFAQKLGFGASNIAEDEDLDALYSEIESEIQQLSDECCQEAMDTRPSFFRFGNKKKKQSKKKQSVSCVNLDPAEVEKTTQKADEFLEDSMFNHGSNQVYEEIQNIELETTNTQDKGIVIEEYISENNEDIKIEKTVNITQEKIEKICNEISVTSKNECYISFKEDNESNRFGYGTMLFFADGEHFIDAYGSTLENKKKSIVRCANAVLNMIHQSKCTEPLIIYCEEHMCETMISIFENECDDLYEKVKDKTEIIIQKNILTANVMRHVESCEITTFVTLDEK